MKDDSIGDPDVYLGAKLRPVRLDNLRQQGAITLLYTVLIYLSKTVTFTDRGPNRDVKIANDSQ